MASRLQIEIIWKYFIFVSLFFLMACNANKRANSFVVDQSLIESGDIVFRRSFGIVSDLIVARLNDSVPLSHCGIAYRDSAGQLFVIHTLSKKLSVVDGMQICSFADFLRDSRPHSVRVTRFVSDSADVIGTTAVHYLYKAIPFDEDFNMRDTTKFFCTQLPLHIIQVKFQINLVRNNINTIPKFSTLFQKPYFVEIDVY